MPVTKSAKKALRQDRRRATSNQLVRQQLKRVISKTKGKRTAKELAEVYRVLDRAAKRGIIHQNKAARIKSRLAKLTPTNPKLKVKKRTKK